MSQLQKIGTLLQSLQFQTYPAEWHQTHATFYLYSSIYSTDSSLAQQTGLSNIHHVTSTNPAPKLKIDIVTLNGAVSTAVLPNSGADTSAAGTSILSQLNEHTDNF